MTTHGTRVVEQPYGDLYRHPDASELLDSIEGVTQEIPTDPKQRAL